MRTFQRGDVIQLKASKFRDFDGAAVVPSSVTCRITYEDGGIVTTATPTMAASGDDFVGTWDSAVADEGTIDWYIKAVGSAASAVVQGSFTLSANEANPQS